MGAEEGSESLQNLTDLANCKLLDASVRSKINKIGEIHDESSRFRTKVLEEQFNILITERLVDPEVLWRLYIYVGGGILRENLDESISKLFALYLFESGLIKHSLAALLDNSTVDGVITTLSNSFVPNKSEMVSYDFAIRDIIDGLCQIDQLAIATQFATNIGLLDEQADAIFSEINFVSDLKDSCSSIEHAYTFIKANSISISGQSLPLHYPQLLVSDRLNIWSRLQIFTFMTTLDAGHTKKIFIKKQFIQQFLSSDTVLRRFIEMKALTLEHLAREPRTSQVSLICDALDNIYYEPKVHPLNSYFSIECLSTLSSLAYDKHTFYLVWNAFTRFERKLEGRHKSKNPAKHETVISNRVTHERALEGFLRRAIDLNLTTACSDIIVRGNGNFPEKMLIEGLLRLVWAKKKSSKYQDEALYCDPTDVDTGILERAINACPQKSLSYVLSGVLHNLSRQFPFTKPCPGRILWNLLLSIQNAKSLKYFPSRVETKISSLITSRPHLEQLRYMALPKVTSRGIMMTLEAYVTKLTLARNERTVNPEALESEADVKLVLSGLLLLNEKEQRYKESYRKLVPSSSQDESQALEKSCRNPEQADYFGRMITNLFRVWNEKEAVDMLRILQNQKVKLADNVVISCLAMLLHRNNYALALQLLSNIATVPHKAYFDFLIHTSKSFPKICFKLMTWLKHERNITIPSYVIRKMIVGFSNSNMLNDSESNRRVVRLIQILKFRRESLSADVAREVVNSILLRALKKGWGSRKRLTWALDLAKKENVPESQIEQWHKTLEGMKKDRQGYWGVKYYHRPKFY
ncbi:hypothetical protein AWJ20_1559 [Sugiyamaella lignohabitans]|uniref:Uncharacterized protein n=1 Tax=Sugiyamaella lignohabitans TaxID=796027 RepID=A0A167DTH5_9ASCO|nr:uncharacterized protein AWJ20_1559 [Sugiyamaella lignohabitans]ANB13275.1 hypothetical protein AWJ20_1559 [Sugiyamaella lignohabitans]